MAGQDKKVTGLTELTSVELTDLLYVIDDPSGLSVSQKVTVDTLLKTIVDLGTSNNIPKFSGLGGLADSSITDDGSTVEISNDFIVDTDTVYVDTTIGRVGINKVPTQGALDVNGDAYTDGAIIADSGTASEHILRSSFSSTVVRIESTVSGASRLFFRNTTATGDTNQLWSRNNEMVINAEGAEVQSWANGNSIISGGLDVNTTTGAIIAPRLTTTERNSLTAVAGMIIYNTTTSKHEGYDGSSWNAFY